MYASTDIACSVLFCLNLLALLTIENVTLLKFLLALPDLYYKGK